MMQIFKQHHLVEQHQAEGNLYFEFLKFPDISAGLYVLPAGGTDPQEPHAEDEFYVVLSGQGSFSCAGESQPIEPGDVIFVPAHDPHRFHDITADLSLLVFFGPAEGDMAGRLQEQRHGSYTLTTDRRRVDIDWVHQFLTTSYWRAGCSRDLVARAIANSLCFSIFDDVIQVGFGRVITDYATYGYISDVIIAEEHRHRGLATGLVTAMLAHPHLRGLGRWSLHTRDAHELYRQFGFEKPEPGDNYMEFLP